MVNEITPGTFSLGLALPQVISTSDRVDPDDVRRLITMTEEVGFSAGWVLDQFAGRMPTLEPLNVLAFASAVTRQLVLGVAVLVPAARSPLNLAKAVASVDQLSGGRLVLGLGLGHLGAMPAFGLRGEPPGSTLDRELTLLEQAWTGDPVVGALGPFHFDNETIVPRPVQGARPPVWFGGSSLRALERAVSRGDGWVGAGRTSVDEAEADYERVRELLVAHGRPRDTFTTAKRLYVVVDVEGDEARERVQDWFGRFYGRPEMGEQCTILGGPEACTDALHKLAACGFDHVIIHPIGAEERQLRILADEVLPNVLLEA